MATRRDANVEPVTPAYRSDMLDLDTYPAGPEGREVVFCDPANPIAWVQSDRHVSLEETV